MTVTEIKRLLQEYPRLTAKIMDFGQDYRKLVAEKEEFLLAYPQFSEEGIRSAPTNKISDPTFDIVYRAIKEYDGHVERLAARMQECIRKKEYLESLFGALEPIEYDVIDLYFFRGLRPNYIAMKLYISRRTFFRLQNRAIEKMAEASAQVGTLWHSN